MRPRALPSKTTLYQFARFAIVGLTGFIVTTSMVYATRDVLGPGLAGIPAFLVAVTTSWALNRSWTFRYSGRGSLAAQWLHYVVWTAPTVITNFTVYEVLIYSFVFVHAHPIVATASAAVSGMLISFTVMRRIVFKPSRG